MCYCSEVMSLTSLKKYIYETLNPDGKSTIEARLNILYAVYITVTTGLEVDFMKGKQLFQILVSQHSQNIIFVVDLHLLISLLIRNLNMIAQDYLM